MAYGLKASSCDPLTFYNIRYGKDTYNTYSYSKLVIITRTVTFEINFQLNVAVCILHQIQFRTISLKRG